MAKVFDLYSHQCFLTTKNMFQRDAAEHGRTVVACSTTRCKLQLCGQVMHVWWRSLSAITEIVTWTLSNSEKKLLALLQEFQLKVGLPCVGAFFTVRHTIYRIQKTNVL